MTIRHPSLGDQLTSLAERLAALSEENRALFAARLAENGIDVTKLPIVAAPRDSRVPLSAAQRRLWSSERVEPGGRLYTILTTLELTGRLDLTHLCRSLDTLIARHEILRTTFDEDAGGPVQVIARPGPFDLRQVDLGASGTLDMRRREAEALVEAEAERTFDLTRGPLVRGTLIRLADDRHWLVLSLHHIVFDEWSDEILTREFVTVYNGLVAGAPPELPALPIQYADYALWESRWLTASTLASQLAYWKDALGGEDYLLTLPSDRPRPALLDHRGSDHWFELGPTLTERLGALARMQESTLFTVLLAAFHVFLYRHTGQSDIRVGTPIANRHRPEVEGLLGFFANTLVLRGTLTGSTSFTRYLTQVRETVLAAHANQDVSFDRLVEVLAPRRRLDHTPLFQTMFSWHRDMEADASAALTGLSIRTRRGDTTVSKFDLTLHMSETPQGLVGQFIYRTDLFNPGTIARFAERFARLVSALIDAPELPIARLSCFEDDALPPSHQVEPLPFAPVGLHVAIRRVAERQPDAPALTDGRERLTYAELERRANRLAHRLRVHGVGLEHRVALCGGRSADLIVAMIAVLKCGGAYLPLDLSLPRARLLALIEDGGATCVLWDDEGEALLASAVTTRGLKLGVDSVEGDGEATVEVAVPPDAAAYVIYTSGSTGKPKGVLVTHRGIESYTRGLLDRLALPERMRFGLVSTLAADLGNTSLYGALLSGGLLHLVPEEIGFDADALGAYLTRAEVDVLKIVPSHLAGLLHAADPAQILPRHTLVLGGEASSWELVERVARVGRCRVLNHYGPTETTVGALTYLHTGTVRRDDAASLPLGLALANSQVWVLDGSLQPLPIGVPGELYIGGEGLARGYLGQPARTAESFVPSPYGDGARVYRTGDQGRRLADGSIEYLGRRDHQVKLRGYRIELSEIRARLLAQPCVFDAHVLVRPSQSGQPQLVAYLVGHGDAVQADALIAALSAELPAYMVPSHLVWIEKLPVTRNGKLDVAALPDPDRRSAAAERPATEIEAKLLGIFREVLKVDEVGLHDNFFRRGGDSILILQVVARARRAGLKLTPKQLFAGQTVAEAAKLAAPLAPKVTSAPAPAHEAIRLTPSQHWFFAQPLQAPHHFHQSVLLELLEPLDIERLERALHALVAHHDALRMRFEQTGKGWAARYHEGPEPRLTSAVDLSGERELDAAIVRVTSELQQSFDLARGPLLRALHIQLGGDRGERLFLAVHHLVVDGVSYRILLEDLRMLYEHGSTQLASSSAFASWSQALGRYAESALLRAELPY